MHRTRLKDLAAQTYIRWQELLAHCQPQVAPPPGPRLGRGGKWSGRLTRAGSISTPMAAPDWQVGRDASEDLHHGHREAKPLAKCKEKLRPGEEEQ